MTDARQTLVTAQGKNGDLSARLETKATSLSSQSDTLVNILGNDADADLAEVATRMSGLEVQYQAIVQTFVMLARLSLLNYLD